MRKNISRAIILSGTYIVVAAFSVKSPRIVYGLTVTKCGNKGMIYESRRHEFGMRIFKCFRIEQQ